MLTGRGKTQNTDEETLQDGTGKETDNTRKYKHEVK